MQEMEGQEKVQNSIIIPLNQNLLLYLVYFFKKTSHVTEGVHLIIFSLLQIEKDN